MYATDQPKVKFLSKYLLRSFDEGGRGFDNAGRYFDD